MRRMRVAGVVATMAIALAGCGGPPETSGLDLPEYQGTGPTAGEAGTDGRSAPELLAGAKAAVAEAESVTLKGDTTQDDVTLSVDMAFDGADASGSFSIGTGTFTIIAVDGQAWYKGDDQAYGMFGVDAALLKDRIADRWVVAGSSHPKLTAVDVFSTREDYLSDFVDPGPEGLTASEETIDGVRTIGLSNDSGTMYVDAESLRPARLVHAGDEGQGIAFTYDEVEKPVAPPADQIVDLADL